MKEGNVSMCLKETMSHQPLLWNSRMQYVFLLWDLIQSCSSVFSHVPTCPMRMCWLCNNRKWTYQNTPEQTKSRLWHRPLWKTPSFQPIVLKTKVIFFLSKGVKWTNKNTFKTTRLHFLRQVGRQYWIHIFLWNSFNFQSPLATQRDVTGLPLWHQKPAPLPAEKSIERTDMVPLLLGALWHHKWGNAIGSIRLNHHNHNRNNHNNNNKL